MVDFARVQGGRQIQTGGILVLFRGFEFGAQRRNRVKAAVYGWAPVRIAAKPMAVLKISSSYGAIDR
jgi:hypothetical protein